MELELCATVGVQIRVTDFLGHLSHDTGYYMKPAKSVIGLQRNSDRDLEISVSTGKCVNHRRFLAKNVRSILKDFINEGKMTIQMNIPQVDVMFRNGKVNDLKALVNLIQSEKESARKKVTELPNAKGEGSGGPHKQVLTRPSPATSSKNEEAANTRKRPRGIASLEDDLTVQRGGTCGNGGEAKSKQIRLDLTKPKAESDQKRINRLLKHANNSPYASERVLKVSKKEKYPRDGLLSSLIHIESTGLGMIKIDKRILTLQYLQILNLSSNQITSVEELKSLNSRLVRLTLDANPIKNISKDFFLSPAVSSLTFLSLKNIQITVLPRSIVHLGNLTELWLDQNSLQVIPYNITLLRSLRYLGLRNNQLTFLPFPLQTLRLTMLDISRNNFHEQPPNIETGIVCKGFPTLLELAAESVKNHNRRMIATNRPLELILATPQDVPRPVYDFLESLMSCFKCSRMAARYTIIIVVMDISARHFDQVIISSGIPIRGKMVVCNMCGPAMFRHTGL